MQWNAGLCWFSTKRNIFPNITTITNNIMHIKMKFSNVLNSGSHWSLLNKVYHKLENYFQCAYKIVAAILHQCKRKTCCLLKISLKQKIVLFCRLYFKLMVFLFKREGINCHIFSFVERNSDRPTHKYPTYFDLTTLPLWNRNGKNSNQTNKCYWKSVSKIEYTPFKRRAHIQIEPNNLLT